MTRSVLLVDPNLEHRQAIARNLGGAKLRLAAEAMRNLDAQLRLPRCRRAEDHDHVDFTFGH